MSNQDKSLLELKNSLKIGGRINLYKNLQKGAIIIKVSDIEEGFESCFYITTFNLEDFKFWETIIYCTKIFDEYHEIL